MPTLPDTLLMLRRRWLSVLAPAVLVIGVALVYAQFAESRLDPQHSATQRLSNNPLRTRATDSLEQYAILVNEGKVGQNAAAELPEDVVASVTATALPDIGVLEVKAVADLPDHATAAAATYGNELIKYTNAEDLSAYTDQLATVAEEFRSASENLDRTQVNLALSPDDPRLAAERDAAVSRYRTTLDAFQVLEGQGVPDPQLRTLSEARPKLVPPDGFIGMDLARQIAVALAVGLVLGLGLAYLLEAIDRRLEGPALTSEAFGVPVLAEVPFAGNAFAKANELAPSGSTMMEAYRRLRTIVQLERDTAITGHRGASVILIVSAGPGEGKTVTTAHLGVALGEVGAKVLLISADFRRPALHRYFNMSPTGGIESLATLPGAPDPDFVKPTKYRGVKLITGGAGTAEPVDLIHHAQRVVSEARDIFDYVLIDTSPLLVANDALDFMRQTDAVIVVSRFRKTTTPAAHRVRDLLFRTGAPVLGVVTVGVSEGEGYGLYYGAEYRPVATGVDDRVPLA